MAKTALREDGELSPESPPVSELSTEGGEISIGKYLELHGSGIHKYTQAYIESRFCGIIKSEGSWEKTVKAFMEGEK